MAVTYSDYICGCYNSPSRLPLTRFATNYRYGGNILYENNYAFKKYLQVNISSDRFEIPCIYKYITCNAIFENLGNQEVESLCIPMLVLRTESTECKSANPILKVFFRETHGGSLLCRMKAGDTWYVGGEGIIMYEDFTPLLLFTLEVQKTKDQDNNTKLTPLRQILRINPAVYTASDLLAKHIKSTMIGKLALIKEEFEDNHAISYYRLRESVLKNTNNLFTNDRLNYDFKVIIDDFSNFFVTPSIPDCTFRSDSVNRFLFNASDDLIESMKL